MEGIYKIALLLLVVAVCLAEPLEDCVRQNYSPFGAWEPLEGNASDVFNSVMFRQRECLCFDDNPAEFEQFFLPLGLEVPEVYSGCTAVPIETAPYYQMYIGTTYDFAEGEIVEPSEEEMTRELTKRCDPDGGFYWGTASWGSCSKSPCQGGGTQRWTQKCVGVRACDSSRNRCTYGATRSGYADCYTRCDCGYCSCGTCCSGTWSSKSYGSCSGASCTSCGSRSWSRSCSNSCCSGSSSGTESSCSACPRTSGTGTWGAKSYGGCSGATCSSCGSRSWTRSCNLGPCGEGCSGSSSGSYSSCAYCPRLPTSSGTWSSKHYSGCKGRSCSSCGYRSWTRSCSSGQCGGGCSGSSSGTTTSCSACPAYSTTPGTVSSKSYGSCYGATCSSCGKQDWSRTCSYGSCGGGCSEALSGTDVMCSNCPMLTPTPGQWTNKTYSECFGGGCGVCGSRNWTRTCTAGQCGGACAGETEGTDTTDCDACPATPTLPGSWTAKNTTECSPPSCAAAGSFSWNRTCIPGQCGGGCEGDAEGESSEGCLPQLEVLPGTWSDRTYPLNADNSSICTNISCAACGLQKWERTCSRGQCDGPCSGAAAGWEESCASCPKTPDTPGTWSPKVYSAECSGQTKCECGRKAWTRTCTPGPCGRGCEGDAAGEDVLCADCPALGDVGTWTDKVYTDCTDPTCSTPSTRTWTRTCTPGECGSLCAGNATGEELCGPKLAVEPGTWGAMTYTCVGRSCSGCGEKRWARECGRGQCGGDCAPDAQGAANGTLGEDCGFCPQIGAPASWSKKVYTACLDRACESCGWRNWTRTCTEGPCGETCEGDPHLTAKVLDCNACPSGYNCPNDYEGRGSQDSQDNVNKGGGEEDKSISAGTAAGASLGATAFIGLGVAGAYVLFRIRNAKKTDNSKSSDSASFEEMNTAFVTDTVPSLDGNTPNPDTGSFDTFATSVGESIEGTFCDSTLDESIGMTTFNSLEDDELDTHFHEETLSSSGAGDESFMSMGSAGGVAAASAGRNLNAADPEAGQESAASEIDSEEEDVPKTMDLADDTVGPTFASGTDFSSLSTTGVEVDDTLALASGDISSSFAVDGADSYV